MKSYSGYLRISQPYLDRYILSAPRMSYTEHALFWSLLKEALALIEGGQLGPFEKTLSSLTKETGIHKCHIGEVRQRLVSRGLFQYESGKYIFNDLSNLTTYTGVKTRFLNAYIRHARDLSGSDHAVFWTVYTKTKGFGKPTDWIALSQFQDKTGMLIPNICRSINRLVRFGMIIKKFSASSVQTDTKVWVITPKLKGKSKVREINNENASKPGDQVKQAPHNNEYQQSAPKTAAATQPSEITEIASYFESKYLELKEEKYLIPNKKAYYDSFRKMLVAAGSVEAVKVRVDLFFASKNNFIKNSTYSPEFLVRQWGMLKTTGIGVLAASDRLRAEKRTKKALEKGLKNE